MNKQFSNLLVTLTIVYLALVFLIGVAVYAVVKYFCLDITLSTNILIWTATLFAPVVILATFNSWKEQKNNEIVSQEAIKIAKTMNSLLPLHRKLFWYKPFKHQSYDDHMQEFNLIHDQLYNDLIFLKDAIENLYDVEDFIKFDEAQKKYIKTMYTLIQKIYSNKFSDEFNNVSLVGNMEFDDILEEYSLDHTNLYKYLIRISTYRDFKNMNLKIIGSDL